MDPIQQALATIPSLTNVYQSACLHVEKERSLLAQPAPCPPLRVERCTHLQSLSLCNLGLTDVFVTTLATAMRHAKLKHVGVRFNAFTDVTHEAWHETLQWHNTTLTSLSLDKNNYTTCLDLLVRCRLVGRASTLHGTIPTFCFSCSRQAPNCFICDAIMSMLFEVSSVL